MNMHCIVDREYFESAIYLSLFGAPIAWQSITRPVTSKVLLLCDRVSIGLIHEDLSSAIQLENMLKFAKNVLHPKFVLNQYLVEKVIRIIPRPKVNFEQRRDPLINTPLWISHLNLLVHPAPK